MRRAARVDDNQSEIVAALRAVGCTVQSLAAIGNGCPDLLVADPSGELFLFEVKDGAKVPSARQLTDEQVIFHAKWLSPIHIVKSITEALAAVGITVAEAK